MRDTLTFDTGGRAVIQEMTAALARRGLPVVLSFDLRTAQAGPAACACHGHASELCECQLVVLLVYGKAPEPLTLVVSGCDERLNVRVIQDEVFQPDPRLATDVCDVLTGLVLRFSTLPASLDPAEGVEPEPTPPDQAPQQLESQDRTTRPAHGDNLRPAPGRQG